jgi:uncharacterized phage protein gp47/JayE
MAYVAPAITASGLSVPSFNDIQQSLLSSYQAIYGSTTALGNDNADYQWISSVSLKLSDVMSLCQLAYNARSPLTAVGADLDSVIKLNGIARLASSLSTAVLTLSGVAETTVANGIVADANGILWALPSTVTIGGGGTVSATATCQQSGAVTANENTINTPVGGFTAGWTGVTNPAPAVPGVGIETDSNLRARQSISVALPSETRLAATQAALEEVPNVTLAQAYENQTNVTDAYGNTGHSLTCVVQGGDPLAIATAIFDNRGIGPNTQGATATAMTVVPVTDPNSGNITDIGFIIAQSVPIYVSLSVHGLTSGFTTATQAAVVAALVSYLNSLGIGEEVTQSALYASAMSVITNLSQPIFSIRALTLGTAASPTGTTDITLDFYQVSSGESGNVILTVV